MLPEKKKSGWKRCSTGSEPNAVSVSLSGPMFAHWPLRRCGQDATATKNQYHVHVIANPLSKWIALT
jgi:hypothetical protein